MQAGYIISAAVHGGMALVAAFGLPLFDKPKVEVIRVTEVEIIDASEFDRDRSSAPEIAEMEDFEMAMPGMGGDVGEAPETEVAHENIDVVYVDAPSAKDTDPDLTALTQLVAQPDVEVQISNLEDVAPDQVAFSMPTMGGGLETGLSGGPSRPAPPAPRQAPTPFAAPSLPTASTSSDRQTETAEVEPEEITPEVEPDKPVEEERSTVLKTSLRPITRPRNFAQQFEPTEEEKAIEREKQEAARIAAATRAADDEAAREAQRAQEQEELNRLAQEAGAAEDELEQASSEGDSATSAPQGDSSLPKGPPMTAGERDGLRLSVQACWNTPAGIENASGLRVVLAVDLDPNGRIVGEPRLIEPATLESNQIRTAFEAARRALIRCEKGGYELPREKYARWKNLEVGFDPSGVLEQW